MKPNLFFKRVWWMLLPLLTMFNPEAWGQASTYTSNVTLSTSGGTNAYTCNVTISSTNYSGIRIGKSKNNGTMKFTVPIGTTTIYIHAAAWDGEAGALSISTSVGSITAGASPSLTADANISGSGSTFNLANQSYASTNYFKTVTLSGVTSEATITVTSASKKRAVIWGINYVAGTKVTLSKAGQTNGTFFSTYFFLASTPIVHCWHITSESRRTYVVSRTTYIYYVYIP